MYIANVYIVPDTSTHLCHDVLGILQGDIAGGPLNSDVIICGDYNAHTNVTLDYMIEEIEGGDGELRNLIPIDSKLQLEIIADMHSKNSCKDTQ